MVWLKNKGGNKLGRFVVLQCLGTAYFHTNHIFCCLLLSPQLLFIYIQLQLCPPFCQCNGWWILLSATGAAVIPWYWCEWIYAEALVKPAWLWNFPEAWNWKETESYPPSLTHPPHSWKLAEGKVCNKKCCILTFHDKTVLYFNVLPKKVLLSGSLPPSLSATLLMWLKVKPELLQHYISYMTYNEICLMLQFWMSQIIKIHESWAKNLKTRLMRFLRFGWLTTTWWVTSWLCGKATHI